MNFSLSPLPSIADVELKHQIARADYQLKVYSKNLSVHYRETGEVLDYLALEHPSCKKTNQKHDQRKRKKDDSKRNWRSICIARASVWLEIYQAPFLKDGRKLYRREIRTDGKEYRGARGAVVGITRLPKPKRVKDRPLLETGVKVELQPFTHNPLFEENVLKMSKPSGPVPEPTPTITGWESGEVEHNAGRSTGRLQYDRLK